MAEERKELGLKGLGVVVKTGDVSHPSAIEIEMSNKRLSGHTQTSLKRIQIPKEQTPREYLVVRVKLVHVRLSWWRRLFGLQDKLLTAFAFVANTPQEAVDTANQIGNLFNSKKGYYSIDVETNKVTKQ